MTRNEFINLRVEDKVLILNQGKNKGKMGIVKDIIRGPFEVGVVYLEPFECQFEFGNNHHRLNKEGFYGWKKHDIGLPKKTNVLPNE